MPLPLRYRALEAVAAALQQMSPADGYHSTPAAVLRAYRSIEQVREFPTLLVLEGNGSPLDGMTALAYRSTLIVTIYGYVKADEGASRSQRLEELDEDVARCLLLPHGRTWWGTVPVIGVLPVNVRETDQGLWEPLGGFASDYAVLLQDDYGNEEG